MQPSKAGYKKSDIVRTRLLDVAEELFAERGFYGVSVRDITDRAALRNASINYHFQSKEKLFMAVIDRRIEPLAQTRLAQLNEATLSADDHEGSAREIAQAFAGPMFALAQGPDPGWKHYCILIAHLGVQKVWTDNVISAKYDQHAQAFLDALRQTFPHADEYRIQCSFQFLLSTTLYAVCDNKRIDTLSDGTFRSADMAAIQEPFLDFVSAGIVATATHSA